jgi:putative salt-induced outer membrane protein YdiY
MDTKVRGTFLIAVWAIGTCTITPTQAADSPAEVQTNKWETTAAAGVTLTQGNSDTVLATLSLDTKHKWDKNEVALGISGGYGESEDVKNTEFLQGFGQYNRLFSDRFYAGLRLEALYDGIANLDYRVRISPLAGYYLIKDPKTTLAVEAGPSVVFEKYSSQSSDTYLGVRFGERFEHKLTATTKIWQSVDYVPQVDKWVDKYLITAEVGIDAAITKQWSLRLVFQDIYDSMPASEREHNDMRLIAGTAYKF